MSIRHALPADVDTLAEIEAASYPPAEGASRQSIAGRVAVYPDCFWLLDEGGEVKAFVNGFVTDMPDLTDEMYDDPHLHTPKGAWQMIFSVVTAPAHRHEGCASRVLRQVCADAKAAGRKGIVLTCKERLVDFYARLGFVDEGLSESTHGNVVWHQMRLALTHAVGTGNPTANGSAKTAERTNDADTTAMSGVDHDAETLEFPQVEPTA